MFERPHHRLVADVLSRLDGDLLAEHGCWFGGGTAIALSCGEYRESVDIDFLDRVQLDDEDLTRVRVLRRVAIEALTEANRVLARYAGIDPDTIDSVTVPIGAKALGFDGVPPAMNCQEYRSGGACAYWECDPPGATLPCLVTTYP